MEKNEPTSILLPPFIRVVIDYEKVDNTLFDLVLDSSPPFEGLTYLTIECLHTTVPKVAALALFGNVIRIHSFYFDTNTDSLLFGAFLYKDDISFSGTDKVRFFSQLQFGHYDEAFNKILKDCNVPYYYKYGQRMEI